MAEIRTRVLSARSQHLRHRTRRRPPGEHEVTINVEPGPTRPRPSEPFDVETLPTHDLGLGLKG